MKLVKSILLPALQVLLVLMPTFGLLARAPTLAALPPTPSAPRAAPAGATPTTDTAR